MPEFIEAVPLTESPQATQDSSSPAKKKRVTAKKSPPAPPAEMLLDLPEVSAPAAKAAPKRKAASKKTVETVKDVEKEADAASKPLVKTTRKRVVKSAVPEVVESAVNTEAAPSPVQAEPVAEAPMEAPLLEVAPELSTAATPVAEAPAEPAAPAPVAPPNKPIVESYYPPYQKPNFSQPAATPKVTSTSHYPPYQGVTKIVQTQPSSQNVSQPPPAPPLAEPEPWEKAPVPEMENETLDTASREAFTAPAGTVLPPYEPVYAEGLVEVSGKGFGFLREPGRNYAQSPSDIFVTPEVIRRYLLRDGQWIKGEIRKGSRGPQLFKLTEINGEDPERYPDLTAFEELVSINPDQRIKLETVPDRYTTRVIDLITPIGKGQRGLIVAPPRTGKTTLLQHIAEGVIKNHPSMKLIILLVDERPEEVTEIRRTIPQAEIMASSNDHDVKAHTRIVQLAVERAKRLVEAEEDVFILLDSITRVARAFNNSTAGGGRTGSGGLDTRAMEIPRKMFAAARNTEQAGSLTIVATALIDTGSLMDEVIFQEFKGTGNMELVLDRKLAEMRIFPAIDIFKSGTRREELLLSAHDLEKINTIRRGLSGHRPGEAIERLLSFLRKFPTNAQMLREIPTAQ